MPLIDDYSEEEDDVSAGGGGGARSFAGGSARQAQSTPQQQQGFVPWSRFVAANEDVSKREAGKLQSQVQGDIDKAKGKLEQASLEQEKAIDANYEKAPTLSNQQPAFGAMQKPQASQGQAGSSFGKSSAFGAQEPKQEASPWGSMGAPKAVASTGQRTAAMPESPYTSGASMGIRSDKLFTDGESGAPKTSGFGLTGGKDLEAQVGKDAWASLMADTDKAQAGAKALGSEAGVKALLGPQASAFDAALISGQGGPGFQGLAKQYGGDQLNKDVLGANTAAQDRWRTLMGDVSAAGAARDADINAYNAEIARNLAGGFVPGDPSAVPAPGAPWRPTGYTDLDSFLNGGSDYQDVHEASEYFSLGNWLARGLGEAGVYDGALPSEIFAGTFAGEGAPKNEWGETNIRVALKTVMGEFPSEAVEYLWEHMTPEMWSAFMGQNPGAIARQMRAWLESAGFVETKAPKVNSFDAPKGAKI